MTDYISRQAAIDIAYPFDDNERNLIDALEELPIADVVEADKAQKEIDYWHDKAQSYEQTILKLALNKADVVEVVRCKDCRWYEINELKSDGTEDKRYKPSMCVLHGRSFRDNYYCADGERAEA